MKKAADIITKNLGYKILAAVLAVIIWLVIVNIEDPEKSKVYTIPVTVTDTSYLTKKGLTYEIKNDTDEISFTVSGRRSIVEELDKNDFVAAASMKDINSAGTQVPIHVSAKRYSGSLKFVDRDQYLQVSVEKLKAVTLPVTVITSGDPYNGCFIKSTSVSPAGIKISGPESDVSQVDTAAVSLDVSGAYNMTSDTGSIVLLDKDGKEVTAKDLTLSKTKAKATAVVLMSKKLALNVKTTGKPADGYTLKNISLSPSDVTVEGKTARLEDLTELTIQPDELDLTGRTQSFSAKISLKKYLPSGVSLAEGEQDKITAAVTLEKKSGSDG
ncbi:MAG: YbbR-like domain-containing protein [Eubacterium sp.]